MNTHQNYLAQLITHLIVQFASLMLVFSVANAQTPLSTKFSDSEQIVLQITPSLGLNIISVNNKKAQEISAFIFLPTPVPGESIICDLRYFQDSCSIPDRWIFNNDGQKQPLI